MTDLVSELKSNIAKKEAEEHVDWFLETLRPLLITHMIHGWKHGYEEARINFVTRAMADSERMDWIQKNRHKV